MARMSSRRVLIAGLSSYWGGRLAAALEERPEIDAVIGVDSEDPRRELGRTEFVRVGTHHGLLRRIVEAAEIDTVVDARLVVDSAAASARSAHESNVMGTMNIVAACSGEDSPVRKLVLKSSAHYYGAEQDDPAFFTEDMERPHPPRTPLEHDIVEAEAAVLDHAEKRPDTCISILRFANVLGPEVRTSHTALFALPAVPMILGFDPRYQFVHEDDVVGALSHAVEHDLPGIFNVAADGVLALSEVAHLLGKRLAPVIAPWGTGAALAILGRLGVHVPPEMRRQLRFGRGLDNRRLKATGFTYRFTTREAVLEQAGHMRLHPFTRGAREPFRYEREVEDFLHRSPNVRRPAPIVRSLSAREVTSLRRLIEERGSDAGRAGGESGGKEPPAPVEHYDDLEPGEIASLLDSLEPRDLEALGEYERSSRARPGVVTAIETALERRARRSGRPRGGTAPPP